MGVCTCYFFGIKFSRIFFCINCVSSSLPKYALWWNSRILVDLVLNKYFDLTVAQTGPLFKKNPVAYLSTQFEGSVPNYARLYFSFESTIVALLSPTRNPCLGRIILIAFSHPTPMHLGAGFFCLFFSLSSHYRMWKETLMTLAKRTGRGMVGLCFIKRQGCAAQQHYLAHHSLDFWGLFQGESLLHLAL